VVGVDEVVKQRRRQAAAAARAEAEAEAERAAEVVRLEDNLRTCEWCGVDKGREGFSGTSGKGTEDIGQLYHRRCKDCTYINNIVGDPPDLEPVAITALCVDNASSRQLHNNICQRTRRHWRC
jgi:hypothetical protein